VDNIKNNKQALYFTAEFAGQALKGATSNVSEMNCLLKEAIDE